MSETATGSGTVPEPGSLAELQAMSGDELRRVDAYQWGGSITISRLLRSIIRLAADETAWRGPESARSLREFWYNPVKPIVERAFPAKLDDPEYDFTREITKMLSDELSTLVKDGELTYRELNILDDSRKREIRTDTLEDDKILFVEKDAAYRKLTPLGDVYNLSVVSGSGWQATALIEDLAHALDDETEYHLFVLSDYDPTGFKIARDFSDRSETLGIDVASVERVAIDPEQVDDETAELQQFKPSVNNDYDERWMREYGIDGRYGLEIEAISGQKSGGEALREIVVDALRPHIRETRRAQSGLDGTAEMVVEDAAHDVTKSIVEDLEEYLIGEALSALGERPAVTHAEQTDSGVPYVTVDLETARDGEKWVPDPLADGELHECAVSGETPMLRTGKAVQTIREHLEAQIAAGEVPVDDLLGDNE